MAAGNTTTTADKTRGWMVGDFPNVPFKTGKCEFKVAFHPGKEFRKATAHPMHTLVVLAHGDYIGSCPETGEQHRLRNPRDWVYWAPNTMHEVEILEEGTLVFVVRWPPD